MTIFADQGTAAMRGAARVHAVTELELAPFTDTASIEDRAVQVPVHDTVDLPPRIVYLFSS